MKLAKTNSFESLRLLLAMMVLISHASDITGLGFAKGLGKIDLGTLGVFGFFSISGYLITPGLVRGGARNYLARRFFRIYPAYLLTVILLALLFCPLWSYLEFKKIVIYYMYIAENIVFLPQSASSHDSFMNHLSGFPHFTNRPGIPNAPFWSLSLEFACYLMLAFIWWIKLPHLKMSYSTKIFGIIAVFWPICIVISLGITDFSLVNPSFLESLLAKWPYILCFLIGSAFSLVKKRIRKIKLIFPILLILIWFGSFSTFRFALFGALSLAIFVITIGESKIFTRIPVPIDISYGIYLYHFPIEQTLAHSSFLRDTPALFLPLSLMASTLPAYLSAKFIEVPFQRKARLWFSEKI